MNLEDEVDMPLPIPKKLHQLATEFLKPLQDRHESALIEKYHTAILNHRTTNHLTEIVFKALNGQIKHLYINEKLHVWGTIDRKTGRYSVHTKQLNSKDDDILDDLAEIVLFHRGQVTLLPTEKMPEGKAAVAILRSPVGRNISKRSDFNQKNNEVIYDQSYL